MDNDKLIEDLKNKLKPIITNSYKDIKPELEQDLNDFLKTSKVKLERWVTLLSTAIITQEEFEWLLKSQLDLVALQTLQAAGITKIRLNTLKNTIVKTIFKIITEMVILGI
jgi:hypothetical protein